jgi:hypothetical protein
MLWMAPLYSRFLAEARNPPSIAICWNMHNLHVHWFVPLLPIHKPRYKEATVGLVLVQFATEVSGKHGQ